MKAATRLRPLLLDTQLPFLYETNSIRAALQAGRRLYSSSSQSSEADSSHLQSQPSTNQAVPIEDGSIQARLSAVLRRFQGFQDYPTEPGAERRPKSFLQQKAEVAQHRELPAEGVLGNEEEINMPVTITEGERSIFKRIFENLAHGRPASTPLSKITDHGMSFELNPSLDILAYLGTTDPKAILDELYSADLKGSHIRGFRYSLSQEEEDEISKYPKPLRKMARKSMAKAKGRTLQSTVDTTKVSSSTLMVNSTTASTEICSQVLGQISKAMGELIRDNPPGGDFTLFEYCEKHIIPLLKTAVSSDSDKMQLEKDKKDEDENKIEDSKEVQDVREAKEAKEVKETIAVKETKGSRGGISLPENIPAIEILSVVGPAAMLLLLRYLTGLYPSSQLISSLIPMIKAHGPTVYVLGTSTPFYNTLLAYRWHYLSDFGGMENLLTDMDEHVIPFNLKTIAILDSVREDRFFSLTKERLGDGIADAETQESMRPAWWWLMESNRADFKALTEDWRQRIADSLEGKEDVPDATYGDEMVETLMRESQEPPVIL